MGEYLKDTPEFVELELGESLVSRTETLGELIHFRFISLLLVTVGLAVQAVELAV